MDQRVWRQEQCQVCGKFVDRATLRRAKITYLRPQTQNYFLYSEPALGGWTSTLTAGGTCYGSRADAYTKFDNAGTASVVHGSSYYTGDGYLYTSTTYDVSTWTSLCFRCIVNNHPSYGGHYTVRMGIGNAAFDDFTAIKVYASHWDVRYAFMPVAISAISGSYDMAALKFYIRVTPEDLTAPWYADTFQLIKDPVGFVRGTQTPVAASAITSATYIPNHTYPFVRTTGAAVVHTSDGQTSARVVVCPKCRDERLRVQTGADMRMVEIPEEPIHDLNDPGEGLWK